MSARRQSKRRESDPAFTLIELLIVVAIIALLALIAVPNFLEAQIRAKAARARADLRTVATALEAYATDVGDYPRTWYYGYGTLTPDLTTPVAYITSTHIIDPFAKGFADPKAVFDHWKLFDEFYTYHRTVTEEEFLTFDLGSPWLPAPSSIDGPSFNPGAFQKFGQWRLMSIGPDRDWIVPGDYDSMNIPYDPTNGAVSFGNIGRTQLDPEGIVRYRPGP